jgi:hypothetical protein
LIVAMQMSISLFKIRFEQLDSSNWCTNHQCLSWNAIRHHNCLIQFLNSNWLENQESRIKNQESKIKNQRSRIEDQDQNQNQNQNQRSMFKVQSAKFTNQGLKSKSIWSSDMTGSSFDNDDDKEMKWRELNWTELKFS